MLSGCLHLPSLRKAACVGRATAQRLPSCEKAMGRALSSRSEEATETAERAVICQRTCQPPRSPACATWVPSELLSGPSLSLLTHKIVSKIKWLF